MSQSITFAEYTGALALLNLEDSTVSETQVRSKRTAAAKVSHPDLFPDDLEKQFATERLSHINEACDLLLDCLERGILPRFHFAGSFDDSQWKPTFGDGKTKKPSRPNRSKPKNDLKSQPAWVRDEYRLFVEWCATIDDLTVERMDKEWKRRLASRQLDEELTRRREAEAAERLRQEILAEDLLVEEEQRRAAADAARAQKRLQKLAEAAERKRTRQVSVSVD